MIFKRKSDVCPGCGVKGTVLIKGAFTPPHAAGCLYQELQYNDYIPGVLINREMMKDFGITGHDDKPYKNWFAVVVSLTGQGRSFEQLVADLQRMKDDPEIPEKEFKERIQILSWLDKHYRIELGGHEYVVFNLGGLLE